MDAAHGLRRPYRLARAPCPRSCSADDCPSCPCWADEAAAAAATLSRDVLAVRAALYVALLHTQWQSILSVILVRWWCFNTECL